MNVRQLGVPIYEHDGHDYVLVEDMRLALDSDVFHRIFKNEMKFTKLLGGLGVEVEWLERQH